MTRANSPSSRIAGAVLSALLATPTLAIAQSKRGKGAPAAPAKPTTIVTPVKAIELPKEMKGSDPKPETDAAA